MWDIEGLKGIVTQFPRSLSLMVVGPTHRVQHGQIGGFAHKVSQSRTQFGGRAVSISKPGTLIPLKIILSAILSTLQAHANKNITIVKLCFQPKNTREFMTCWNHGSQ